MRGGRVRRREIRKLEGGEELIRGKEGVGKIIPEIIISYEE